MDHITNGRIIAGLGVSDNPRETKDRLGIPGVLLKQKLEKFEEYIIGFSALLRGEEVSNEFLSNTPYKVNPLPISDIPILIAGNGEKVTLRLVAQYAQMSNMWGSNDVLADKLNVLAGWCDKIGSDYDKITKTTMRAVITGENEDEIQKDIKWYQNRMQELGRPVQSLEDFKKNRFVGTIEEVSRQIMEVGEIGISQMILTVNTENSRNSMEEVVKRIS